MSDSFEMIVGYLNPDIVVRSHEVHHTEALRANRLVDESVSSKDHGRLKVGVRVLVQDLKRHIPCLILIAINEGVIFKEQPDL